MFQLKGTRSSERRIRDKPADKCLRVCLHQLFQTIVPGFSHSNRLLPLSFSVTYANHAVEGKGMQKHSMFDPLITISFCVLLHRKSLSEYICGQHGWVADGFVQEDCLCLRK